MEEEKKKYKSLKYLVYSFWIALILVFAVATRFIVATANGDLPAFSDLENPQYDQASLIYDIHDEVFGKYYVENREVIEFKDISKNVINTLLATEDIRYFKHSGVDLKALFRVAIKTVLLRRESSGGGSTISQQLAKLLFKRSGDGIVRTKVKEWITSIRLERSYTKEEIIAMYLNKFEFINGAHGIQAAAQTYFNVKQEDLNIEQAALLVGMLKNPSLYNPLRFPENASQRRNVVLRQLEKYYDVDEEALDTIMAKPVDMSAFEREAHDTGPAPYFRSELTKWLKELFKREDIKKADGSEYNIYTDGLKIHTTIDLNYQRLAEKAVKEHMINIQKRYWEVWQNRNPWTYDADSTQRLIRRNTLERKIKETERYLKLHDRFLSQIKTDAQAKYNDISLSENVIKGLIDVERKRRSWNGIISNNTISKAKQNDYEKLLKDQKLWSKIKTRYQNLQEAYNVEFKKKIKLQVFDYNSDGYKEVEMSPLDSVKYHNQFLQAGLLAVHPKTGHIKAWVGGPGFSHFKYDHVNSRRQVGSTIKPFVYATAISLMGISPCQQYDDIQYTIAPGDANFLVDKEWSPSNANEKFTGNPYNLYQGLLYSKNSITIRLVKEMGNVDVIREMLDAAGIEKDQTYHDGRLVIPRVPSISLGAVDLTLAEMAGAYTTFANDGVSTKPVFIDRIEDKTGKTIYTGVTKSKRAINSTHNGVMVDMLRNNVGGSYKIGVKTDIGGKTGTTNDYADGWFMSITPELVTGVWVGGDDKWIRFLSLDDGQGFVMARPIVQNFIKSLESDSAAVFNSDAEFPSPPANFLNLIDCEKYKQMSVEEEQNITDLNKREDDFEEEFDEEFGDFEEEFDETFDGLIEEGSIEENQDEFLDEDFDKKINPQTPIDTNKVKPPVVDTSGRGNNY